MLISNNKGNRILSKLVENYERRRGSSMSQEITDTCLFNKYEAAVTSTSFKPKELVIVPKPINRPFEQFKTKITDANGVETNNKAFNIEETVIYKPPLLVKEVTASNSTSKTIYQKEIKKNKGGCFLFKCFA
jgi:hypothetical protein